MSLLKSNSVQIGQSATATQNFTLSVPSSPNGTIKLARGNSGATTDDILSVNSSGNFGVGTTSINARLVVSDGANGLEVAPNVSSSTITQLTSYNRSTNAYTTFNFDALTTRFSISGTERLRINSGGFLKASNDGTYVNSTASFHEIRNNTSNEFLVGSNSNSVPYGIQLRFTASPNNTASTFITCNDGDGTVNRAIIRSNGGFLNYQANDANLSDERLKKDIIASPNYLEKICSIPVVNFKYKDQTHDDYNLGVIAQQLEAVCPELVDADGFGETPIDGIPIKTIYQTDLQYALMKCIQELKAENDSLKSRVAALEAA